MTFEQFCERQGFKMTLLQTKCASMLIYAIDSSPHLLQLFLTVGAGTTSLLDMIERYYKSGLSHE